MKYDVGPLHAMQPLLAVLLVALYPLTAHAAGPVIPDAGAILQQIQSVAPPSPSSSGTGLTIERGDGAKLPPSAPFEVKSLRISGNTLFETKVLHALVADAEGTNLTLSELNALVARITDFYQSHGYSLARAIIPAQVIRDDVVVIEVIEARYGKINLDNRSQVNDPLLEATLAPLQSGQAIDQTALDHALLLLSDIPGVALNATLKPGETVGTSDLLVNATSGPAVSGNVVLDGYGNRYTGRARVGGTVNVINPLHHGDVLSASGLTAGSGLNYGRLGYESLLNGQGTRLGGAYSALDYSLGKPFTTSDGTAQVASLWAKHPLLRSRDVNLYGQVQYDRLRLRDRSASLHTDRHLDNWTASLSGDARDALLSGGINTWNISVSAGRVGFDDADAQSSDAANAKTQGGFSKWNMNLARLQSLGPKNTLYFAVSGQWSDSNLDSSQKMSIGGPYTVRAYDMGAVSGDTGYLATAELRRDLGAAWSGQWQVAAFIDSARVTVNKTLWPEATGANSATLSGAGVGLNWAGPNQWRAKATVATPIGSTPVLVRTTNLVRAWVEIGKGF